MKNEAEDFVDQTMRRCFVQRLLVLYLGSAFGAEWTERTVTELGQIQIDELVALGLTPATVDEVLAVLASWSERHYGLYFTYTAQDEDSGPDFKLTFIDEMDSDPDVMAMRKMMAVAQKHQEAE